MNLDSYKAVFFDVGGTLIRVYPSVGEIYAKHAQPFGFQGTCHDLDYQFGKTWKEVGGLESIGKNSGPEIERKFWHDIVKRVFEPSGGLKNFDLYFERVYQAFLSAENWKIYEDVMESGLLDKLKKRKIILGIISNWDSRLESILEVLGLAKYFDFILASTVVGSAKPNSEIFKEALRKSGVNAKDACHIGDEIKSDFDGAKNLGINPILIDRQGYHNCRTQPKIRSFMELAVSSLD